MPKQKTHKGLAKRVKITGRGKVRRGKSFGSHLMSTKNSKRRRRIGRSTVMNSVAAKLTRELLGV